VAPPPEEGILEVHGLRFFYDAEEDEVWLWEERGQVWAVLPDKPAYLKIVNDRLAVVDFKTRRHRCNCPLFLVMNLGCKCGGV
jgi:hypothetical protein